MYLLMFLVFRIVLGVSQHNQVLVVSFDGFRYNYFNKNITPTMEGLKLKGTHAKFMRNVFVTKTYPNHHSIATGFYPETHGVVANSFFDPRLNRIVNYSEEMWKFDDSITPIWILNELAGEDRHSGVYMWPGSDYSYSDTKPTYMATYSECVLKKWPERVDTVIDWLTDPTTPANLVMMYFEEPDKLAHRYGADSKVVEQQIVRVDKIVDYLMERLMEDGLQVNVILLSDHGMVSITNKHIISVTELLDNSTLVAGVTPALHVIPPDDQVENVYLRLEHHSSSHNYTVYRQEDLLDRWHFKNNIRVPPILLLADEGYGFDDLLDFDSTEDSELNRSIYGAHGYDNALASMHPFFLAWGPQIRKNFTIPPFDTVDLYSLFCTLLDLEIPPTNGSLANVLPMVVKGRAASSSSLPIKIFAVVAVSLMLMGCACCITHQILKQSTAPTVVQSYKLLEPPRIIRTKPTGDEPEEQRLLANTSIDEL